MAQSAPELLERDAERSEFEALIREASHGRGAVLVAEGPAGIGKTALLAEARRAAATEGLTVLAATGSPLDRDFPFGLVHQLFDPVLAQAGPERRAELLAGAAARAGVVLDPARAEEPPSDPSHAVLHGLYWLSANLAEQEPLLVVLDDLHWADRASLRWLEFLGRRLEGLRVAVAVAARANEPGADAELLAAISGGPAARVVRPEPLSEPATAALVAEALGDTPDPGFARACRGATGGNPLLVRELTRAAAERGMRGTSEESGRVTALGSRGLSDAVGRRLSTLGPAATTVARAAAVLGERAALDDVAALAGLTGAEARDALDALAAAEVLEPGGTRFAHPLVREAVAAAMPAGERTRLHGVAGRRLAERRARPQEVAAHLLATEPRGDPEVARALREAAVAAVAEGAADAAAAYLERAIAEPPAAGDRPGILLELGEMQALAGAPQAGLHLGEALAGGGLTPDGVARAHAALGRTTLLRDPVAAAVTLERAVQEARDPALALRVESLLLDATAYDPVLDERRAALLEAGRQAPDPSPVMLAHLAQDAAYRARPVAEVEALARRSLLDGALLAAVGPESGTYHLVVLSLRHAEIPGLAERAIREGEAEARRRGSRVGGFYMDHARAYWELMYGSVGAAEAHARGARAATVEAGLVLARIGMSSLLAEILIERDELAEAEAIVGEIALSPATERMVAGPDLLSVRAQLHRIAGRPQDAVADARRAYEITRGRGWTAPLKGRVGLELAAVLGATGATEEALAIIAGEEDAARRAGTSGTLGSALRIRARLVEGEERLTALEASVAALRASPLELERAWALHDLGATLRRARRAADAREPLREALAAARAIGATRLAAAALEELLSSGARPRREALSGPESLTPTERRVAELAAARMTNREIAESLWVTRKTVEVHLSSAYGKLGIRSRSQLAEHLAA